MHYAINIIVTGKISSNSWSSAEPDRVELSVSPTFQYSFRESVEQIIPNIRWFRKAISEKNLIELIDGDLSSHFLGLRGIWGGLDTLVIQQPHANDSGVYVAGIDGFFNDTEVCVVDGVWGTQTCCDKLILPLLAHNAFARPVAFEVKVQGKYI